MENFQKFYDLSEGFTIHHSLHLLQIIYVCAAYRRTLFEFCGYLIFMLRYLFLLTHDRGNLYIQHELLWINSLQGTGCFAEVIREMLHFCLSIIANFLPVCPHFMIFCIATFNIQQGNGPYFFFADLPHLYIFRLSWIYFYVILSVVLRNTTWPALITQLTYFSMLA